MKKDYESTAVHQENSIDWDIVFNLCTQLGAMVDLAERKMREARQDPSAWKIEADIDTVLAMLANAIDKQELIIGLLTE